jgi:hypothetical protein
MMMMSTYFGVTIAVSAAIGDDGNNDNAVTPAGKDDSRLRVDSSDMRPTD